jgi:hypothetical protein
MRTLRRQNWEQLELLSRRGLLALFPPEANARIIESGLTISVVAERG